MAQDEKFVKNRIERTLRDLAGLQYLAPLPIALQALPGYYRAPEDARPKKGEATEFGPHQKWGGRNSYTWFFADTTLPQSHVGKPLVLRMYTEEPQGLETNMLARFVGKKVESWDLMNPQFLVFLNGELQQAIDTNHLDIRLGAASSPSVQLDLQGFAGMTDRYYGLGGALCILDEPVKDLYYDMLTIYEAANCLDADRPERNTLLGAVRDAVNLLDLRSPGSTGYYTSIKAASGLLNSLYGAAGGAQPTVICVGHSHIDVAWLWDLAQTRQKARRTFSTVRNMMGRFPGYTFMQSTPQLYKYLQQDEPALYADIKELIKQGRWEAEGGMWLEADCNIPSGESFVRQILYGKRFFQKEFGLDNRVLWMPDVFGYSAALPQILKKSGFDLFVTTKISWNSVNKMPYDTFAWKGINGDEILTHFITTMEPDADPHATGTTYSGQLHPASLYKAWQRYQQKDLCDTVLTAYGHGDGGGGPTDEMVEKGQRLQKGLPGYPRVKLGTVGEYTDELLRQTTGNPLLPQWSGELYLELHQGTYTSMGEIKRNNRKAEYALRRAELWQTALALQGGTYPREALEECWQTLLLNQFHDTLPGSCIEQVYIDSRAQFAALFGQLAAMESASLDNLLAAKAGSGESVTVCNTLGFATVGLVQLPGDAGYTGKALHDTETGETFPLQKLANGSYGAWVSSVPGFGWKTFEMVSAAQDGNQARHNSTTQHTNPARHILENAHLRATFDANGEITSLFDKGNNREVVPEGETLNALVAYDDRPASWENWNLDPTFEEKCWPVREEVQITCTENGPVRQCLQISRRYGSSTIVQNVSLCANSPRLDFATEVDWQESSTALKAVFPTAFNSDSATYAIQFGNLRRPTHRNTSWDAARYEVCAHEWMDLSEGNYGLSVLNDCKYGCDIHDGVMRLTLLKCGLAPWKEIDRGMHSFTYSLYPHAGDCFAAATHNEASRLNQPLYTAAGGGAGQYSLAHCNAKNVRLDTAKLAEDSDTVVLRLYEHMNCRGPVEIALGFAAAEVWEADLLEHPLQKLPPTNGQALTVNMAPYEIKTLLIKPK